MKGKMSGSTVSHRSTCRMDTRIGDGGAILGGGLRARVCTRNRDGGAIPEAGLRAWVCIRNRDGGAIPGGGLRAWVSIRNRYRGAIPGGGLQHGYVPGTETEGQFWEEDYEHGRSVWEENGILSRTF